MLVRLMRGGVVSRSGLIVGFIILAFSAVLWTDGLKNGLTPCVTDCGETFVARHQVTQFQRYGFKYGLMQDHATSDDLAAHPFLYTHNVSIPAVLFPLLAAAGIASFAVHQLLTLLASALGLYYVFKATSYHTRANWIGVVMLGLFSTDYVHVFSFGLNALRSWHWVALFGLLYHVGRLGLGDGRPRRDRIAVAALAFVAFGIGYDFWAICLFLSCTLILLCMPHPRGVRPVLTNLLWIGVVFAIPVVLRQIHVASVLGAQFWLKDFVFSAGIKVPLLRGLIDLPPIEEIDRMYREFNVVRAPATPAPGWAAIVTTLRDMVAHVTVPSYGSIAIGLTVLASSVALATLTAWTRAFWKRLGQLLAQESAAWLSGCSRAAKTLVEIVLAAGDRLLPQASLFALLLIALEAGLMRRGMAQDAPTYAWAVLVVVLVVRFLWIAQYRHPPSPGSYAGLRLVSRASYAPLVIAIPFIGGALHAGFRGTGLFGGLWTIVVLAALLAVVLFYVRPRTWSAAIEAFDRPIIEFLRDETVLKAGRMAVWVLMILAAAVFVGPAAGKPTFAVWVAVVIVMASTCRAVVARLQGATEDGVAKDLCAVRRALMLVSVPALLASLVILSYGWVDPSLRPGFGHLRFKAAALFGVAVCALVLIGIWRPGFAIRLHSAFGLIAEGHPSAQRARTNPGIPRNDPEGATGWHEQALGGLRLLLALSIGAAAGLIFFAPLSLHIYLKHEFPLVAAPVTLAKALAIAALCVYFWRLFLLRNAVRWVALGLLAVVIVDHVLVQHHAYKNSRPVSTAWISEMATRDTSSFAVSWVSDVAAPFTSSWVVGVAPGQERDIARRIAEGQRAFEFGNYFLFGQKDRALRGDQYLFPAYWLYFPTDHASNFDRVSPDCTPERWVQLWRRIAAKKRSPTSPEAYLWVERGTVFNKGSALAVGGQFVSAPPQLQRIEVRDGARVVRALNFNCIYGSFAGVLDISPSEGRRTITYEVFAISGDRDLRLGSVAIKVSDEGRLLSHSDLMPWAREPQPSIEEMILLTAGLPVAARGEDFVIFDMSPARRTRR